MMGPRHSLNFGGLNKEEDEYSLAKSFYFEKDSYSLTAKCVILSGKQLFGHIKSRNKTFN